MALRIRSARTRDTQDTRGQALVEFALVLPVLVLIMLGVMQFGILFWSQITLTQIARDTGRWAVSQGWQCGGAATPEDPAWAGNITAEANAIAQRSTLFGWSASNQLVLTGDDPDFTFSTGASFCPPITNQEVWNISFELNHTVPVFIPFIATNACAGGCERTLNTEVQFRMEPKP